MKIVVDTNRVVAALIKDSLSRFILTHGEAEFITIWFGREELKKHKKEILEKANVSEEVLELILDKLFQKIVLLDDRVVAKYLPEAEGIIGKTDKADAPFIAAALATGADIWSEDKHFLKQDKIRIWRTAELAKELGLL